MKKTRNRINLDFDMTPLLDVIFIVLMVVMCHQALDTKSAEDDLKNVHEQLDEAISENTIHETQLYAYENTDQLVAYVILYADYDAKNPTTRNIQLAYNNDVAFEEITISPENEEEAYALFETKMVSFLSEKSEMPVIIVLNEDNILYRDQVRLSEMLGKLGEQYPNLYQAEK